MFYLNPLRGWAGEIETSFYLWISLNSKTYHKIHNLIIPSTNGTAQLDHIVISIYGIFIVETKNKKGWIFGSESQAMWTQTLYNNTKYSFQNPLKQTFRQKKVLASFLNLHESKISTVINFVGDCEFRTELPANVINSGVGRYIKQFRTQIFSVEEVELIKCRLQKLKAESTLTTSDHVKSLHERHSSTTICPRCGSPLTERTAKQGKNAGTTFLGCSNYPKCRFAKSA